MKNKKAEMGIGTLIIFIAMILVAAIAASVLIQTATSLQNKALQTGERSKTQVSTNILPIVVYGEDGSNDNALENFVVKAKLSPGSDSVTFDDLLLEFSLKNGSEDLEYNSSLPSCNETNASQHGYDAYAVEVLIEGDNYKPGYLQRGDVVKICFESERSVQEDESVSITLAPKVGSPTSIDTALPDIITEKRITIYP